jgi:phage terminase small subunit
MPTLQKTKWERFCNEIIAGKNYTAAMIAAGYKDTIMTHTNANRMIRRPEVAARIEELKQEMAKKYLLSREDLLRRLGKIIVDNDSANRDVINGIQLMAKMQGFLADDVNLNIKKTVEDLSDEQLAAIVNRAESSAGIITPQTSQN